jgi:hypothetical protein
MKTVRILVLICAAGIAASAQAPTRRIFVTALAADGTPYTDLGPDDFIVKEGGKPHTVSAAGPALDKMQIAILVDDNGSGLFRVAVARFIEALLNRAEFSIRVVAGQTMKLVDWTEDPGFLSDAVAKLGARPGTSASEGTQLLDGIVGASRDLDKHKAKRPIIVAMTVGGTDVTPMHPDDALNELKRSGAELYVVSVLSSQMRQAVTPTKPVDILDEGHALQAVLGDGPPRSGGDRVEISALAGVETGLRGFAEQLKHQLFVEYPLDGAKPSDRVSITLKRKDVTLRAPTHVPNRISP